MKKSVYSLVLSDEVVAAVDKLAYRKATNRSNLINQILAEHLSLITPEKRIRQIFGSIAELFGAEDSAQRLEGSTDNMLTLRSALAYKYNPTVRYSVLLYRQPTAAFGELRVGFRTQNRTLIAYMNAFYRMWSETEARYIGNVEFSAEDGKYARRLVLRRNSRDGEFGEGQIADAIVSYIRTMDIAMKSFFETPEIPELAARRIDDAYREYLSICPEII